MHPDKTRLRTLALRRRRRLKKQRLARLNRRIRANILRFLPGGPILMFSALPGEPDLSPLFLVTDCALPRIKGKQLEIAKVRQGHLIAHPYGMLQPDQTCEPLHPSQLNAVLIPALLVDRTGRRLGFGGGFYDRFLMQNPHCLRVGCVFSWQIVQNLPEEPHDQRLDAIITEEGYCNLTTDSPRRPVSPLAV